MFQQLLFLLLPGITIGKFLATGPSRINCDAAYHAPCSRVNSEWLSVSTATRFATSNNNNTEPLLREITAGRYNMEQGFYPFVFDRQSSHCVAHGQDESFVGLTLEEIFRTLKIEFSSSSALSERFIAAANSDGGGWVKYFWRGPDGVIGNRIAYVTAATERYYVGVGFTDRSLPPTLPCSDTADSWCSLNNVVSLVGKAQSRLNDARSLDQFETALFDISFDTNEYEIKGGYYLYVFHFDGTLVAHARLQRFFGVKLPDIFVQLGWKYEDGVESQEMIVRAALGENDGWAQYNWKNGDGPEFTKIAYIVNVDFQGEPYYIGCGFNHIMGDVFPGPLGGRCPGYNLPCAFGAAQQLTSHVLSHTISSPLSTTDVFAAVSFDEEFKYDDYYAFVVDYNGTFVAHGQDPQFVGLTPQEAMDRNNLTSVSGDLIHRQMVLTASNGGGFVLYDWAIPGVPDSVFRKIAYVFEVTLDGRRFYGGVGFNHQRAPLQLQLEQRTTKDGSPIPCSRNYNATCSEINAQAILGQALADLVVASSETKAQPGASVSNLTDVLSRISAGDDLYRINDFFVVVFTFDGCGVEQTDGSGCCVAHGDDVSLVGKSWQELLDMQKITSIRGEDIHRQHMHQTENGGDSLVYTLADDTGASTPIKAFSSRFSDNGKYYYVFSTFIDEHPPPTCDACPTGMECLEPDQAFCSPVQEQLRFYRSNSFVTIVVIIVFLPILGLLFCWVGRRREKARSDAQIRKIDEQMRKLREQMEKEQMTAAQTRKLVSSLFPENVRDQILQQLAEEDNKTSSDKLTSFLTEENSSSSSSRRMNGKDRPIAELFPSATIIFADIAGFTAWSSTREPAQVFRLLEGIYQYFDKLAKQRDVFKVETIGDCYVAVAGLPKKMEDHAVVMALFASDCLAAFNMLVQRMEVDLGPDTGDLRLRIGLHSGPVTAGVLKTDKARFQLFGDTVNTASRLESTGLPDKIQISQATADLLRTAGNADWFTARAERIVAKGKGEIQTFWLSIEAANTSLTKHLGNAKHSDLQGNKERSDRLVQWVTDGLVRLLKQIQGQHQAPINKKTKSSFMSKMSWSTLEGKTVLEEVREIIHMPSFRCQEAVDADDIMLDEKVSKQLDLYVSRIASMYRSNAFHNFEHAAHVTMSVLKLMSRIVAPDLRDNMKLQDGAAAWRKHDHTYGITSDPLTQFASAFSALIHDVDHSGVPNTQVVKEQPLLAQKYKGCSVAEQNSVDLAWNLLMTEDFSDLCFAICGGDPDNMTRFRQLVVNGVMSTDIMDAELKELRNMRWDKAFVQASDSDPKDASDRKATIVIDHLIQASDVAHTMQHWQVYRKWNKRLYEEMLAAYLAGRSSTDPVEYWYKGELGFFDYYIIPLAKKLGECGVFGVSSFEYLGYAEQNRQEWELKGKALVEKMDREIRTKLTATRTDTFSV